MCTLVLELFWGGVQTTLSHTPTHPIVILVKSVRGSKVKWPIKKSYCTCVDHQFREEAQVKGISHRVFNLMGVIMSCVILIYKK